MPLQPLRDRSVPESYKRILTFGNRSAFAVNPDLATTHLSDSSLFLFVGVRVAFDLSLVGGSLDSRVVVLLRGLGSWEGNRTLVCDCHPNTGYQP